MAFVTIIEDNTHVREGLARVLILKEEIEKVISFETVEEYLSSIVAQSSDVILLDYSSTTDKGLKSLSKIRKSNSTIRIVAMSQNPSIDLEHEAFNNGANQLLDKSIEIEELVKQLVN